jgi:acyl-CoA thioester hydrolase
MKTLALTALAHSVELAPRYAETDQMGIVYHANYLVWFHEARDALLASLGVDAAVAERTGYSFPVVDLRCRWHAPARYGQPVTVTAFPLVPAADEPLVARLRVGYRVAARRRGQPIADGETTNVITNRDGRLLLRVPECFAPVIERLQAARADALEDVRHV